MPTSLCSKARAIASAKAQWKSPPAERKNRDRTGLRSCRSRSLRSPPTDLRPLQPLRPPTCRRPLSPHSSLRYCSLRHAAGDRQSTLPPRPATLYHPLITLLPPCHRPDPQTASARRLRSVPAIQVRTLQISPLPWRSLVADCHLPGAGQKTAFFDAR